MEGERKDVGTLWRLHIVWYFTFACTGVTIVCCLQCGLTHNAVDNGMPCMHVTYIHVTEQQPNLVPTMQGPQAGSSEPLPSSSSSPLQL